MFYSSSFYYLQNGGKFNLDNITMGQNYLLFACCIVVIAVFSYLLLHVNDKVVQLLKKEAK